jgi:hypothetical protein
MVDGLFDNLTCKPKLIIKHPSTGDYITLETITDGTLSASTLSLQISKGLLLACNAPAMAGVDIINSICSWVDGVWMPLKIEIPHGDNYIRFKDTTTNRGEHFGDLSLITSSGNSFAPLLLWSQGMIIKKDLSVGGFVSANQGVLSLGRGLNTQFDPPAISLTCHNTQALDGIKTLSSPPTAPPAGSPDRPYYISSIAIPF